MLADLATLPLRPDHKRIHWSFDMVTRLFAVGCIRIWSGRVVSDLEEKLLKFEQLSLIKKTMTKFLKLIGD